MYDLKDDSLLEMLNASPVEPLFESMSLEENGKDQVAVRGDRELISDLTRIVAGFFECVFVFDRSAVALVNYSAWVADLSSGNAVKSNPGGLSVKETVCTELITPGGTNQPLRTTHCVILWLGHYAAACKQRNNNYNNKGSTSKNKANVVQVEEIIAAVVSEAHMVTGVKGWAVDSACTRHICVYKEELSSYTPIEEGTEWVYVGDNRSVPDAGKGKALIKLTSSKTLSLSNVLHVPHFRHNLISVLLLGKAGIKVAFDGGIVTLTKNDVFVGKGYIDQGLFVLSIDKHTMTRGGKRFYVIFVDDYSRFTKLYLLRSKDEALEMLIKYKTEVENQKNKRIKRLRTDRGGEYESNPFSEFCEQNGIIHEVTPPYSPESNGVAERKNRTLKEMMNAMLVSSGLSSNMWGEAILLACHIQNKVHHKKTGKTPYELWEGRKPNLEYLKVWGCLAKVMLPEPKTRKLGSRTCECVFIGYACNSSCYRFLVIKSDVLDSNTIIESKNAIFFELVYPMKEKEKTLYKPIDATNKLVDDVHEIRKANELERRRASVMISLLMLLKMNL
uniref:Integrase catalytic domain-containing protein n=1 Tax=Fagus sylvatica TaxID=28930 RepID=A0A2N9GEZ3_FAGSY